MQSFFVGVLPLLAVGGILLMISLLLCLYLYRLRRCDQVTHGYKIVRYGAFALLSTQALCPICLEDFRLGEKIAKCHCGHSFHTQCLVPWLRMHDTCPMCKKNLKPVPRMQFPVTAEV